jgi:hypothetical protein
MSLLEECKQGIKDGNISVIVKQFMKEQNIESFHNIDLKDFEKWFNNEFQYDDSILIALTSSEDKKVMHFTEGIVIPKKNEEDSIVQFASFTICNKKTIDFAGHTLLVALENNDAGINKFVEYCGFGIEKICKKCLRKMGYYFSQKSQNTWFDENINVSIKKN